jgi:hypothetical protein
VSLLFFSSLFYVLPNTENEDKPQRDLEDKLINKIRIWEYGKENFMYCACFVRYGCLIIILYEMSFIEKLVSLLTFWRTRLNIENRPLIKILVIIIFGKMFFRFLLLFIFIFVYVECFC